jgi:hypothetical protein
VGLFPNHFSFFCHSKLEGEEFKNEMLRFAPHQMVQGFAPFDYASFDTESQDEVQGR